MRKISCIVSTHNRADRLTDCLDAIKSSIERAKSLDTELIVVDNNSTDNTKKVLEEFAKNVCFPMHILRQEKQGVNFARNQGLRNSSGDILILIDDDCLINQDYIQCVHDLYQQDTISTLRFSRIILASKEDWPITIKDHDQIQNWHIHDAAFFSAGNVIGCSMIFTREILEKVGYFNEIFSTKYVPGGNDTEYGLRIYLAGFPVEYNPKLVLRHAHGRNNQDSVTRLVKKYLVGCGGNYARFLWHHPHIKRKLLGDRYKKLIYKIEETDPRNIVIGTLFKQNKHYMIYGAFRYFYAKGINLIYRQWQEK
nr:glycosyltransferase [Cytophagales bacterium]